jgi:ADP-ribosylation factor-like protein 8
MQGPNQIAEPPTVGLNVKIMQKGGVSMKVWDIGGQQQFRDEWPRYCKGVDCIVFVVDTADVRAPSI